MLIIIYHEKFFVASDDVLCFSKSFPTSFDDTRFRRLSFFLRFQIEMLYKSSTTIRTLSIIHHIDRWNTDMVADCVLVLDFVVGDRV